MPSPAIRPSWRRAGLLLTVVALLAQAGCGNSRSGSGSAASSTAAPAATAQQGAPPSRAGGDIEAAFIKVIRDVSPSVVQIQTKSGLGSGVVYDGRGDIITNNHVVASARAFTVTLLAGDRHPAKLIGRYPGGDLAVLRLESGTAPAAGFADSSKAQVGELVLAMGNPLGLRSSVTQGIVSSLGRTVSEGNGVVIAAAVQTSAPINPGNSGGALVDLSGKVVGIPTLAATDPQFGGGAAPGIGFAIPSNTVKRVADQLITSGRVTKSGRAFLGVEVATTLTGSGVVVGRVQKGGPAAAAGVTAGDRIVSVAGKPTPTADDLATVLTGLKPGQRVPVELQRPNGGRKTVQIKLGESPG
jgi:S1-C subfamily serine protease